MTEIANPNPVEKAIAADALQRPGTPVEIRPDGAGIVIGDRRPWWRRVWQSWVIRIQAAAVLLSGLWLTIPQETILGVIPQQYLPYGVLTYAVITALARMRSL